MHTELLPTTKNIWELTSVFFLCKELSTTPCAESDKATRRRDGRSYDKGSRVIHWEKEKILWWRKWGNISRVSWKRCKWEGQSEKLMDTDYNGVSRNTGEKWHLKTHKTQTTWLTCRIAEHTIVLSDRYRQTSTMTMKIWCSHGACNFDCQKKFNYLGVPKMVNYVYIIVA